MQSLVFCHSCRSYNLGAVKDERKTLLQELLTKSNKKEKYNVDTKALLDDTLVSCFGTADMPSNQPTLPSCIDGAHTNSYYLTQKGKISVARLLYCFAYNTPDVQFCPMLYPITAILRHYMSEPDKHNS